MRINKYLSAKGVCSRREADRLLEAGRITVDGAVAECGQQVDDNNIICIDGSKISNDKPEDILIAFNKPVGIVCTTTNKQGLILLTNNGEITDRILRSVNGHEKEYIVKVNKNITKDFLDKMSAGVYLKELNVKTKQCRIYKVNSNTFRIVLTQGLNRQIRRMCQELGYKVEKLTRIRVMNIELGDLACGEYRVVEGAEKEKLYNSL